jgi:glycosyltransferase involved in cell wall biosynthesis
MKVTVAMPAFNAGAYIRDAIESVLAQDLRSFEVIIIDDGSTDDTWRQVKKYASHPRVRISRSARNRGVGATRNVITAIARGAYLCPCDADDILLPGALTRLSRYLDTHPSAGAVYGDVLEIWTDANDIVTRPPKICGADHLQTWDLLENVINHPGSMIRRKLIQRVGGYDEAVHSVDDWSLWLKLAEISRIVHLAGEVFYVWRRHPSSVTNTDENWERDVARIRRDAMLRRYGRSADGFDGPV